MVFMAYLHTAVEYGRAAEKTISVKVFVQYLFSIAQLFCRDLVY